MNENKETQDENSREEKFDKEIPVYNFVCTPEKPLTWSKYIAFNVTLPTDICLVSPPQVDKNYGKRDLSNFFSDIL